MSVAVDNNLLVYAIQKNAPHGQEDLIAGANAWLDHLAEVNETVLVTAPVLTEFLFGFAQHSERERFYEEITSTFRFTEFGKKEALLAADLLAKAKIASGSGSLGQLASAVGQHRNVVKFDALVVAAAKLAGVRAILSADGGRDLRVFASLAGLEILSLEDLPGEEDEAPEEDKVLGSNDLDLDDLDDLAGEDEVLGRGEGEAVLDLDLAGEDEVLDLDLAGEDEALGRGEGEAVLDLDEGEVLGDDDLEGDDLEGEDEKDEDGPPGGPGGLFARVYDRD